jgi:hypothetical protein
VEAKVGVVEARSHDATDQDRRLAGRSGTLPDPAGNQDLWLLAGVQVTAKHNCAPGGGLVTGTAQAKRQRAAAVPKPQFVGADDVPARPLSGVQQEVDRCGGAALPAIPVRLETHR